MSIFIVAIYKNADKVYYIYRKNHTEGSMKKKTFLTLLCTVIIAAVACCAFVACENNEKKDNSDIKIVVLGDSIAEGIIGPTPAIERDYYSYLGVVGQINGFTYRNRSVSGHTTKQMLEYISKEADDTAYAPITHIKEADVIVVSILGNDLLQRDFDKFSFNAIENDFTEVDNVLERSYANVEKIVKRLRELNPDCALLFQTVYNPMHPGSTLMSESSKQKIRDKYEGWIESDFYTMAGLLINRLNNVLYRCHAAHPDDFEIIDVNGKFDALHRADENRLDRLIYPDFIHPSNEGHAVIASVIQQRLEELGIADHDYALKNYKELRKEQLDRLYKDTAVDRKKTKKAIDKATTMDAVTQVYFDAVDGVTPNY